MPNFAVRRDCFRPPQSGHFQLCSAYPLERRELTHGLLHVRSVPFVLGDGDLTFRSNGGDVSVPAMPRATLDLAAVGEWVAVSCGARVGGGGGGGGVPRPIAEER